MCFCYWQKSLASKAWTDFMKKWSTYYCYVCVFCFIARVFSSIPFLVSFMTFCWLTWEACNALTQTYSSGETIQGALDTIYIVIHSFWYDMFRYHTIHEKLRKVQYGLECSWVTGSALYILRSPLSFSDKLFLFCETVSCWKTFPKRFSTTHFACLLGGSSTPGGELQACSCVSWPSVKSGFVCVST